MEVTIIWNPTASERFSYVTEKGEKSECKRPLSTLKKIDRWASLGRKVIGLDEKAHQWELSLVIPVSAFFRHKIDNLSGLIIHGNFYKCGDKTAHPHFLSWNPIGIPVSGLPSSRLLW